MDPEGTGKSAEIIVLARHMCDAARNGEVAEFQRLDDLFRRQARMLQQSGNPDFAGIVERALAEIRQASAEIAESKVELTRKRGRADRLRASYRVGAAR